MIREIRIFFTALMFYTRIPCPKWVDHDPDFINLSIRYFPLIGWVVGGLSGAGIILFALLFDNAIAAILSIVISVFLTGGFHEDGFADMCDGFGGGWTKDRILTIMKDSRVGTYGVVGLVLLWGLKVLLLVNLIGANSQDYLLVFLFVLCGHSISRLIAASFVFTHEYVREDESSKSKPVAKQAGLGNLFIAALFGLVPLGALIYYTSNIYWLLALPVVYLFKVYLGWYFKKWIGGYTGDCLGATQQITEVVCYASLYLIWKFI